MRVIAKIFIALSIVLVFFVLMALLDSYVSVKYELEVYGPGEKLPNNIDYHILTKITWQWVVLIYVIISDAVMIGLLSKHKKRFDKSNLSD